MTGFDDSYKRWIVLDISSLEAWVILLSLCFLNFFKLWVLESILRGKFIWTGPFLCDKTNFYVAIVAKDNDVQSTYKGRDQRLWEEDVLELFIKPNFSSSVYYEFQFSPTNQVFDAYWSKRGEMGKLKEATSWNSNLRSAVHIDGTLNQSKDKNTNTKKTISIIRTCI